VRGSLPSEGDYNEKVKRIFLCHSGLDPESRAMPGSGFPFSRE